MKETVQQAEQRKPTDNLRRQHEHILRDCKAVEEGIAHGANQQLNGSFLLSRLTQLSGKLRVYLAMEDEALDPALIIHDDKEFKSIALRYKEEMGGLAEAYTTYASRWKTKEEIEHNPAQFALQTKIVFLALRIRISKESPKLYELVDKLGL
jgi:hypothetical protein